MSKQPDPLVPLGKNGPGVAHLGFGLMGLTYEAYGTVPSDEERFQILDRAHELGARNWDTSDLYGDGEALLNKWFKRSGKREDIFLATKFGFVKGSKTMEINSSGEYCKKACAESLRNLGVEFVDLFYMHHANPKTPIEETMRAMVELQKEGKIKYIGLSAISSTTLRRACKVAHVDAVQVEYSPFVRDIEGSKGTNLLATCRELGVAVVAAMPLGRGLLTSTFAAGKDVGDHKDMRVKMMPRFLEANRDQNVKVVDQFQQLAEKKGCTAAQLAIAWVLKQGNDIIPIPGTKQLKYLEQNWGALDVDLSREDELEIRRFVESVHLAGGNMPEAFADYEYRDTVEENPTH